MIRFTVNITGTVDVKDGQLVIDGRKIRVTAERNPEDIKLESS